MLVLVILPLQNWYSLHKTPWEQEYPIRSHTHCVLRAKLRPVCVCTYVYVCIDGKLYTPCMYGLGECQLRGNFTCIHTCTYTYSTAPPKRPLADFSAIPTMHGNPNFQRGTPSRSTYAYGTRRPNPTTIQHNFYVPMGGNSQPTSTHGSSGFFKRLIPSRFSRGK